MNAPLPFHSPLRACLLALAALLQAPPLQAERIVLDPPFTYTREDGGREVVQEIETEQWRSRDLFRLWEQLGEGRYPQARTEVAMAYLLGDCLQEPPADAAPSQEPPPRVLETPEPSPSPVLKTRLGQASPKADPAPRMPEWMSLAPTPDGSLLVTDLKGRQVHLIGAGAPGDRKDRCLSIGGPDAECFPGKTPWPLSAVMASDGSIFIADGSLDHVVVISADRATVSTVPVGQRVLSLALDPADILYLGTEAGLCRLDAGSGELHWLLQEYLPDAKDGGSGESKAPAIRCRPEHLLWNRDGSL